jgi:hypothetical protein
LSAYDPAVMAVDGIGLLVRQWPEDAWEAHLKFGGCRLMPGERPEFRVPRHVGLLPVWTIARAAVEFDAHIHVSKGTFAVVMDAVAPGPGTFKEAPGWEPADGAQVLGAYWFPVDTVTDGWARLVPHGDCPHPAVGFPRPPDGVSG